MCLLQCPLSLNFFSQKSHLKHFSSLWVFLCILKLSSFSNTSPHLPHVCVFKWLTRRLSFLNCLLQIWQLIFCFSLFSEIWVLTTFGCLEHLLLKSFLLGRNDGLSADDCPENSSPLKVFSENCLFFTLILGCDEWWDNFRPTWFELFHVLQTSHLKYFTPVLDTFAWLESDTSPKFSPASDCCTGSVGRIVVSTPAKSMKTFLHWLQL